MSLLHPTLRARLTLWYAGSLAFIIVLVGGLSFALVRYQLVRHHDHALEEAATRVEAILARQTDWERLTTAQRMDLDEIGALLLVHEVTGGEVFYRSPGNQEVPRLPSRVAAEISLAHHGIFEILPGSPSLRIYSRPHRPRAGPMAVIRVGESLGDVAAPLRGLALTLLLLAPVAVAASAALGYWLARNALAPVDSVTRLAREIEATSLERRLPPTGIEDEIGRLVRTFNQMIARLEGSFQAMKRFTADASHQLKAPLARIRGSVDIALSKPRETDEYGKTLESIGDDVDHLRSITDDLLVLARADAGRIVLERTTVNLGLIAAEAVESCRPAADSGDVELRAESNGTALVLGDERWLRQLLANLLDNALKFASLRPSDGRRAVVRVGVECEDGSVVLSVEDNGPGLPEGAIESVFERFYRGDDFARGHSADEGAGLGLAIASWIARVHGSSIVAENRVSGGTRFVMRFPRVSPSRSQAR